MGIAFAILSYARSPRSEDEADAGWDPMATRQKTMLHLCINSAPTLCAQPLGGGHSSQRVSQSYRIHLRNSRASLSCRARNPWGPIPCWRSQWSISSVTPRHQTWSHDRRTEQGVASQTLIWRKPYHALRTLLQSPMMSTAWSMVVSARFDCVAGLTYDRPHSL